MHGSYSTGIQLLMIDNAGRFFVDIRGFTLLAFEEEEEED